MELRDLPPLTELIPLKDVPDLLPEKRSLSQVYKWAANGISGVKLRTERYGGTQYTHELWLREFGMRCAGIDPSTTATVLTRAPTTAQKAKTHREAMSEAKRRGLA